MGKLIMTIADHTGEISTVSYPGSDLTALNIDAEEALMLTLRTQTNLIQRGLELKYTEVARVSPQAVGKAASSEAQREEKALVRYYDTITFAKSTLEIPCVNMTKQNSNHPGFFYVKGDGGTDPDWITFVAAFQAYVPGAGGNVCSISEILHVGRNI